MLPGAERPARARSTDGAGSAGNAGRRAPRPLEPASSGDVRELRRALAARLRDGVPPLAERVEILAQVCRRWMDPADPFRTAGIRSLSREAGFAPATAAAGLDATFRPWTPAAWRALALRELAGREHARAGVVPHVLAGSLPAPNLLPLFLTLLAGGAPIARSGRRLPGFAAVALASVAAVEPRLGRLGAVCRWPRERADLTRALFDGARRGTVTGGDEAVAALGGLAPGVTGLVRHPHRASFALVARSAAACEAAARRTAARLARDVALHDQQGCLSPVGVLVEAADPDSLGRLARALARSLDAHERRWPRSRPLLAEAAAVRSFPDAFALTESRHPVPVLAGPSLGWVIGTLAPGERPPRRSPLFRCVWVASVAGAAEALRLLAPWRGATAALGFRGAADERRLARAVALGLRASRLCAVGRMQSPPLAWRQDGVRPLRALLG